MQDLESIINRINQLQAWNTNGATLQECLVVSVELEELQEARKLLEHTAKIKAKIESGTAIDKSIIDREAIKELNHKEAHSKAKVVKAIEHKLCEVVDYDMEYSTIIVDITIKDYPLSLIETLYSHIYILCTTYQLEYIDFYRESEKFIYAHTFKYSSKSHNPKIGYKEHLEFVLYTNKGYKPVNHLLPNVIESTYAKDSRNLGFYTNLLLRSANAGDTILGINITNGNLIKAAQAMLCSTVTIPADNIASRECEKTIKELQFK